MPRPQEMSTGYISFAMFHGVETASCISFLCANLSRQIASRKPPQADSGCQGREVVGILMVSDDRDNTDNEAISRERLAQRNEMHDA